MNDDVERLRMCLAEAGFPYIRIDVNEHDKAIVTFTTDDESVAVWRAFNLVTPHTACNNYECWISGCCGENVCTHGHADWKWADRNKTVRVDG